jgi:hypothetical protein
VFEDVAVLLPHVQRLEVKSRPDLSWCQVSEAIENAQVQGEVHKAVAVLLPHTQRLEVKAVQPALSWCQVSDAIENAQVQEEVHKAVAVLLPQMQRLEVKSRRTAMCSHQVAKAVDVQEAHVHDTVAVPLSPMQKLSEAQAWEVPVPEAVAVAG